MHAHVEVLVRLFVLVGATGALTGVSLALLAAGTATAVSPAWFDGWSHPLAGFLAAAAGLFVVAGVGLVFVGRALGQRRPAARRWALAASAAILCLLPFGTALGVYGFWVLVNDEARREFLARP